MYNQIHTLSKKLIKINKQLKTATSWMERDELIKRKIDLEDQIFELVEKLKESTIIKY